MSIMTEEIFTDPERNLIALYFNGSRLATIAMLRAAQPFIDELDVWAAAEGAILKSLAIDDAEFAAQMEGVLDYA